MRAAPMIAALMIVSALVLGCDDAEHAAAEHAAAEHAVGEHAVGEHAVGEHAVDEHAAVASPVALPPGVNAVQNEMRLLHAAMQESVTSIANDDLGAIPHALHRVHRARGITEAALEDGSYRLPRNADQREAFVAMDEAFHRDLEGLVAAAREDDSARVAQQLGVVMSRCAGCHEQFRPEPARAASHPARHDHAH